MCSVSIVSMPVTMFNQCSSKFTSKNICHNLVRWFIIITTKQFSLVTSFWRQKWHSYFLFTHKQYSRNVTSVSEQWRKQGFRFLVPGYSLNNHFNIPFDVFLWVLISLVAFMPFESIRDIVYVFLSISIYKI